MHVRVGKSKCKWTKSKSEIVKNDVYSKVYVIFLVSINIFFLYWKTLFFVLCLREMRFIVGYLIKYFSRLSNLLCWQNFCGEKSQQLVWISSGGSNERRKCQQLRFHMHPQESSTISTMNCGGRAWSHDWKEMICEKLRAEKAWPHQKALYLLKQYMEDNMLIHIYQIQI